MLRYIQQVAVCMVLAFPSPSWAQDSASVVPVSASAPAHSPVPVPNSSDSSAAEAALPCSPERADELFRKALEHWGAADGEACRLLEQSFACLPAPNTQTLLGDCSLERNQLMDARARYRGALSMLRSMANEGELVDAIQARLGTLEPLIPSVIFQLPTTPGLQLVIDGQPVLSPAAQHLDPGRHFYRLTAPGFVPLEASFTLRRGERALVEPQSLEPLGSSRVDDSRTASPSLSLGMAAGMVAGVVGAAGLTASIVQAVRLDNEADRMQRRGEDGNAKYDARNAWELYGIAGFGALLVGGAVLTTLSFASTDRAAAEGSLAPRNSPTGVAISLVPGGIEVVGWF